MTTLIHPSPQVRPLADSRPPAVRWRPTEAAPPSPDQPPLDLAPQHPERDHPAPTPTAFRVTQVRSPWTVPPAAGLPDAPAWSARLVVAVVQVLLAQRPVAQLNRWLADDVLAEVSGHQRRRRAARERPVVPVTLVSLRVQHPNSAVAEVAAHVVVGTRHRAVALRLEALADRWLCVALQVGPGPQTISEERTE